jgi:polyhydroxyalkanoate synthesis regulator protein
MKLIRKYKYNYYDIEDKAYISSRDIMAMVGEGIKFKVVARNGIDDLTQAAVSNALRNHYRGKASADAVLLELFKREEGL